jgi:hypothetical protein
MVKKYLNFLSILLLFLFARCGDSGPDLEQIKIELGFDRILLENYANPGELELALSTIAERHPDFFPLYGGPVLGLFQGTDSLPPLVVWSNYYFNPQLKALRDSVQLKFGDFKKQEEEIEKAFQHYAYYFPKRSIPTVFFFLGGFNYTVVALDTSIGIAPDQYLGPASEYYAHLPAYIRRKKDPSLLPVDVLKGWLESEIMADSMALPVTLLDHIIQFGKVWSVAKRCFPEVSDSIISGFSQQQLEFCSEHEFLIWNSLIQDQKLYIKDPRIISKFMNEAPFSPGMPAESPGKAAIWIGWRIVESFLERNPNEFQHLFTAACAPEKLLQKSGFKPTKP